MGPIEEQVMMALVRDGVITESTLVWRDDWITWQPAYQTDLNSLFQKSWHTPTGGLPVIDVTPIQTQQLRTLPRIKHNKSLAILGLFLPGLPQIIFGQPVKGLVILLGLSFNPFYWFFILVCWPINVILAFDAYMVAEAHNRGARINNFSLFPSAPD